MWGNDGSAARPEPCDRRKGKKVGRKVLKQYPGAGKKSPFSFWGVGVYMGV